MGHKTGHRRGPRRMPRNERCTARVVTLLTIGEHLTLRRAAEEDGVSLSRFLRDAALAKVGKAD